MQGSAGAKMLMVLSKEQVFRHMEKCFSKMRPFDVIELCHENSKFAAIVMGVDHASRSFSVLPLRSRHDVCNLLAAGQILPNQLWIRIPEAPCDVMPLWNAVGQVES
jgi:hypothetical protein